MSTSPDLGLPFIAGQQAQPDVTHNEALLLLQALLQGVADVGVDAPPGMPAEGDSYVIGAAPTGAWAGKANKIAIFYGGAWRFVPDVDSNGSDIPIGARHEGLRVWARDENALYVWTETGSPAALAWTELSTGGGAVDSVFGRTGAVAAQAGDYDADQVDYDNAGSGLAATDAQGAIDEVVAGLGPASAEDYEEGTFAPVFTFVTQGDLSVSYVDQFGKYTKIGNAVLFEIDIRFTPTYSTSAGASRITGLPFPVGENTGAILFTCFPNTSFTWPASHTQVSAFAAGGDSFLGIFGVGSGVPAASWTTSEFPSGQERRFRICGHYLTD